MPKSTRPSLDPHGITARVLRFITGLAIMAGFFSGASAAPVVTDLNQAALDAALAAKTGPMRDFIQTLEHAMLTGETEKAEALVDREAILTRALQRSRFQGDEPVRDLFCDSTRRAWGERGVTNDFTNTKFRYLRTRVLGGRAGLLFRSSTASGALNFALFTVNETKPGQYRITDVFVVGLNEFMSDTIRRTWLNVAAGFLGEDAKAIKGVNPDYVTHIGEVAQASRLMNAGKYEEALKIARTLPAPVQRERSVLLLRIESAEHISTMESREAYTAWLSTLPDEQELPLKFVQFYIQERRYADAERVLRGLMERLGPDTMLSRELGDILFRRDNDKAYVAEAAVKAE